MALLQQFIASGQPMPVEDLLNQPNRPLALEIQQKLQALGLLDPLIIENPAQRKTMMQHQDGMFGGESQTALKLFSQLVGQNWNGQLSIELATALDQSDPAAFLPINAFADPADAPDTVLAKRIVRYMQAQGYWLARHPDMLNIVYVEDLNRDGNPFPGREGDDGNWNDLRTVLRISPAGVPELVFAAEATTEPTRNYARETKHIIENTANPAKRVYAARIAFGQYKAWQFGFHKASKYKDRNGNPVHHCLRHDLKFKILVHRDKDASGTRNAADEMAFGQYINQHSTLRRNRQTGGFESYSPPVPGTWSIGCLVGRIFDEHMKFLNLLKTDVRFTENPNYVFFSSVLPGDRV